MERQRAQQLVRKLTGSPLFPVLFIQKVAEELAYFHFWDAGRMALAAAIATFMWVYTSDDIRWGLYKAAEKAEDVADGGRNT